MRRLAVLLLVTLTACGGPKEPFELGLKEVPSDLLLGRQTKPATPLPAQLPPQTFFADTAAGPLVGTTSSTLPPPIPSPPPPAPPCPEADPRAPARVPVSLDIPRPPTAATYEYRTSGFVGSRQLGPTTTREVGNIRAGLLGETFFDVAVFDGPNTTTTTYHIVPRTSLAVPPGLYISKVDSGGLAAFEPKPELLLLPFPALPGTTFNGAGSDAATTITYDGRVDGNARIDACGTNVDGIHVTLSNGRATNGREDQGTFLAEQFNAVYVIATQYGGVAIADDLQAAAPVANTTRELHSRISQEPRS